MRTYKDCNEVEWTIRLTCADCDREEAAGVLGSHDCGTLWQPGPKFYEQLLSNARLIYGLLTLLSSRDGKRPEGLELDETTFPDAADALRGVVFDFFQSTPTSLLDAQERLKRFSENGTSSTLHTESPDDSALTGATVRSGN